MPAKQIILLGAKSVIPQKSTIHYFSNGDRCKLDISLCHNFDPQINMSGDETHLNQFSLDFNSLNKHVHLTQYVLSVSEGKQH